MRRASALRRGEGGGGVTPVLHAESVAAAAARARAVEAEAGPCGFAQTHDVFIAYEASDRELASEARAPLCPPPPAPKSSINQE